MRGRLNLQPVSWPWYFWRGPNRESLAVLRASFAFLNRSCFEAVERALPTSDEKEGCAIETAEPAARHVPFVCVCVCVCTSD